MNHKKIIKWMKERDGCVDWDDPDITSEIFNLILEAIPDIITSYCETETYMLNKGY